MLAGYFSSSSLFLLALTFVTFAISLGCGTSKVDREDNRKVTAKASKIIVTFSVFDVDVDKRPMHDRAEIWMKGVGSVWLKESRRYLKAVPPNARQELFFYPEGRDGPEHRITFTMQDGWNPKGAPAFAMIINYADDKVTVSGQPLEKELEFRR